MARLRCSFCDKPEADVRHLVAGPGKVTICDECVDVAAEVARVGIEFDGSVLVTGIGELVTNDPNVPGLCGIIDDAALAVRDGLVRWAGPESALPDRYRELPTLRCGGRAVIPGFVDAHTHAVFGGERSGEFELRLQGTSYAEIAARGGGIKSTVAATRATPAERLRREAAVRFATMLRHGTTTAEVKSGYGLETATERSILEVVADLDADLPIDLVPTFLGAHAVPAGMDRGDYVDLIIEEMLAVCAPLADYCDVFCDVGAFTPDEARAILEAAAGHGLGARLHANQLAAGGGARLAADLGAVSADHLDHLSRPEARLLAEAGVVAVVLPGASYSLRTGHAPARMLWEEGVTVAVATDCNPGTSYVESMQIVVSLAAVEMGLTPAQAVWSATRGGALALEQPNKGWLGRGAVADFVVLDAPSPVHLAYRPGTNLAWRVFKDGAQVAYR